MSDDIEITTVTYQSDLDPVLARLKQRLEAELAALTPEQRALVQVLEAEETRRFLFGDSA